ncbi:MAG: HD-GYP domain-containing protein [Desulfohalobiaceae bacterium]
MAQALYRDSVSFAREFIKSIQAGEDFDYDQSSTLVEEMISSLSRNADALISLSKLRQYDEYTYTHSINVAVFSMAYARYLDRPQDYIHALGMAALFHDLGKYLVPGEILNKPGKLSEQEFRVMKRHPLESFQLLREKDVSEEILRGVVEHHERFNGNGYPQGLKGEQQHPFARIIAVADVYDALTSERIYKKAMLPGKALSLMYGLREKDFHPGMVERFIKCLGIYRSVLWCV